MRFRVTWTGVVQKTLPVDNPADALYHVWARYKDDFHGGDVGIEIEEGGRGLRLARLAFPVEITREIAAESPTEALQTFLYDDRVPDLVHLQDIRVVPLQEQMVHAAE
jgi:hypothetical protein